MKRTIAGVLTVLSVLVLSGCAITGPLPAATKEHAMTPDETKAFAARLYEATTHATGGTWAPFTNTWLDCGPDHARYSLGGRATDYRSDPDELIRKVQRAWARFGIHGELMDDAETDAGERILSNSVAHPDAPGASYTFISRSNEILFLILSPCRPNDLSKLDPVL